MFHDEDIFQLGTMYFVNEKSSNEIVPNTIVDVFLKMVLEDKSKLLNSNIDVVFHYITIVFNSLLEPYEGFLEVKRCSHG
jgi:hypothetical protein